MGVLGGCCQHWEAQGWHTKVSKLQISIKTDLLVLQQPFNPLIILNALSFTEGISTKTFVLWMLQQKG